MEKRNTILSAQLLSELVELRKYLHSRPEVSGREKATAAYLEAYLKEVPGISMTTGIGGHGLLAVFDSGKKGLHLSFRADMDALDIEETNSFPHRSSKPGVSHKCGHDGHMSILAGLARWLGENPLKQGKLSLVFQPSEENGEGAAKMLADPKMKDFSPERIYALHNLPGYPLHQVVLRSGVFTAYVKSLLIGLKGKTSHAAEPEHGLNPAGAMALLLHAAGKFTNNRPEAGDFSVVTPVYARLGEKAYGVSAGKGEVHYTLRTWTEENMEKISGMLLHLVERQAAEEGLEATTSWKYTFYPSHNDPEAVSELRNACLGLGLEVHEKQLPFKWGEDFGLFTRRFPGALFGLGAGENCPALHNPDYDFPDELMASGTRIFVELLKSHRLI